MALSEDSAIKKFLDSKAGKIVTWGLCILLAGLLIFTMVKPMSAPWDETENGGDGQTTGSEETPSDEGTDTATPGNGLDDFETEPPSINGGTDEVLARMQESLKQEYGEPPEGFIWDQQGNPISLGIPDMSSEDVVYTYLRALSTLDMGIAQKLSRGSSVIETYAEYHSGSASSIVDFNDEYKRDAYKEGMLSLEVLGVEDSSVFAENKRAYTVNVKMVDFTDKDFWVKDKETLFTQMWEYDQIQDDESRAEQYVNDYVLKHYQSGKAVKKEVTFTVTVQRYPDINSGWLVSVDTDLDTILKNKEGLSSNTFIMNQYREYRKNRQVEEREASRS